MERLVSSRQRRYPSKIKVDVHAIIIPKRIACIVLIVPPYSESANLLSASPHAQRAIVVSMWQQRDQYMDRVGHRSPRGSVATLLCVNDVFEDEVRKLDQKSSQPGILLEQRSHVVAAFIILK